MPSDAAGPQPSAAGAPMIAPGVTHRPGRDAAAPVDTFDLLFFEAGGQVFAASPADVARIDRPARSLGTAAIRDSSAGRVLVVQGERRAGPPGDPAVPFEFQIPVDRVLGVRRFPRTALRRTPVLSQAVGGPRAGEVMGVVLDGQTPVLIIDVRQMGVRASAPLSDPTPAPETGAARI